MAVTVRNDWTADLHECAAALMRICTAHPDALVDTTLRATQHASAELTSPAAEEAGNDDGGDPCQSETDPQSGPSTAATISAEDSEEMQPTLTVTISPHQHKQLQRQAEQYGVEVVDLIEVAITQYRYLPRDQWARELSVAAFLRRNFDGALSSVREAKANRK